MPQIRWAGGGGGIVYTVFPKDKEFRAFEMLEKIELIIFQTRSLCIQVCKAVLTICSAWPLP
jgi:hypothetical protein